MTRAAPTIHASAVCVGDHAVLIRGPSGAGKSRLAFELILAGRAGQLPSTVLIGDDRIHLEPIGGAVIARPAPELAGLIEIRGLGIRRWEFLDQAPVRLVIDLDAADAGRMPPPAALRTSLHGIIVPRLPIGIGVPALPLVVAGLLTSPFDVQDDRPSADCRKGFGNHISPTIATE